MSRGRRPSSFEPAMNQLTCFGTKRSSSRFIALITRLMALCESCTSRIWKPCGRPASFQCARRNRVAQAVEGADPHAAHVHRQHRRQPRQHFLGRLVGEGHRQHPAGRHLPRVQQPGDARGQHAGLARAGAGQDQRRLRRQRDRRQLLGVQVVQQLADAGVDGCGGTLRRVHRTILGAFACCPAAARDAAACQNRPREQQVIRRAPVIRPPALRPRRGRNAVAAGGRSGPQRGRPRPPGPARAGPAAHAARWPQDHAAQAAVGPDHGTADHVHHLQRHLPDPGRAVCRGAGAADVGAEADPAGVADDRPARRRHQGHAGLAEALWRRPPLAGGDTRSQRRRSPLRFRQGPQRGRRPPHRAGLPVQQPGRTGDAHRGLPAAGGA